MRTLRLLCAALLSTTLLAVGACANDTGGSGSGGGEKGSLALSGQNFTEMQIMAQMYKQVLEKAGYSVDLKLVTTRDVYMKELSAGKVDVVPEYLAGIADFLNVAKNGANAKSVTTNSVSQSLQALQKLAHGAGITMLKPAKATDQNAFAVTKKFAAQNNLKTLSDLAAMNKPIVLAAAPDCAGRPDCEGGLTDVYGLNITKILKLGFDSPQTKDSVTSGESDLGLVATTDGALAQEGLVILADDKGIQPAQNLIPAVNSKFLKAHPDVASVLNELSSTLTTSDLASLNTKVGNQREQPADVASAYLKSKGLL